MKRIELILALIFCGLFFVACNKNEEIENVPALIGKWINSQQDTLLFVGDEYVKYTPHTPAITPSPYFYKIIEDTIALQSVYSSNSESWTSYYFKYSSKRIEIRDFQSRERDFYGRVE
jgi:hypothetical protein